MLMLCCVFTEVPWITDEVWTTDEPFVVAREREIPSWCFFSNFSSNVFITLSFLSNWFFIVETWSCSCTINLSKILVILMLSVCDCIRVGSISDVSKSCFLKKFTSLKKNVSLTQIHLSWDFWSCENLLLHFYPSCMFFIWFSLGIDRQVLLA